MNWCLNVYTGKKKFRIAVQEIFQVPKTANNQYFRGMFVIRLELKWHNFGQWESFWRIVDIPRVCLL